MPTTLTQSNTTEADLELRAVIAVMGTFLISAAVLIGTLL